MKSRFLVLAILLATTGCHVCVGQANMSGISNNACCGVKEFIVVSGDNKGENNVVNQNPSPVVSTSPTSSPTSSPVNTYTLPSSTPTTPVSSSSVSPLPSPTQV